MAVDDLHVLYNNNCTVLLCGFFWYEIKSVLYSENLQDPEVFLSTDTNVLR